MNNIITNHSSAKKPNKDEYRDEIYEMTKTHWRNEEEVLELRSYPRAFAKFMGSNDGALFLRQLIYWADRPSKSRDGYFYKSVREWSEELDLTEYQIERFRAFLKDKGILEMTKRRVGKYKEQWFYRLNKQRFKEVYEDFLDYKYKFPHEEEYFDNEEEFAEEIIEEKETEDIEYIAEVEEANGQIRDSASCGQESISRDEATVPSFEANYDCFQENNNNVLPNKLSNGIHSELNSEPLNSRYTQASAKNSRTHLGFPSDSMVTSRNTGGNNVSAARRSLDAFRSVGVTTFDVTAKNDVNPDDYRFRENADLDAKLEESIEWCEEKNLSFIVRPRGGSLIQIDDCHAETLEELLPYCFFAEETSEDNYQAWLALTDGTSEDKLKQIRDRLIKKLDSGNGGSYGATRWVGSVNFKPNRNLFRVRLIHVANGRFTTAEELEEAGLLAEPEKPIVFESATKGFKGCFPDYDRCLRDKKYDRSDADASFLAICKARGFSRAESIEKLEEVSKRAEESSCFYIERTADFVFGKES